MSSRAALTASRVARSSSRNPQLSWRYSNSSRRNNNVLGSCNFHSYALRRNNTDDDDERRRRRHATAVQIQSRSFHSSPSSERAVALLLGLTTLSALGYAGSSAVQSYNEWKAAQPSPEEIEEQRKKEEAENAKTKAESKQQEAETEKKKSTSEEEGGPRKNIFKEWFGVGEGSYYEGGFDDKMTKKEAALILGVRESSSPQRIKDAHRKLLILNHPDTGGSTYLAGKLNEAKELLLKGRRGA